MFHKLIPAMLVLALLVTVGLLRHYGVLKSRGSRSRP